MAPSILFDCDPGYDDVIAIMLTLASPEPGVKAIISPAGNRTLDKILRNVSYMLTLLNHTDISVAGDAVKPLMHDLTTADSVRGENGLDGPALSEPAFTSQDCTAVEPMAKTLCESPEPATIASTGPQANVASPLNSHPELYAKIARIVITGNAIDLGNWTSVAEFNIFVDPETAEIVFQSGIPVVMTDLGVMHKAQIHREDTERFRAIGNPISMVTAELLGLFFEHHRDERWGFIDAPLRDPCTTAQLLKLGLFTTVGRWADMETQGRYIQGMTVVDRYFLSGNRPNATVMVDMDREGSVDLLAERPKLYA